LQVFDFSQPLLLAGLMLGLASSLHCVGMCSGVAAGLSLAATSAPGSAFARHPLLANLLINAGRVSAYALAGALVGAFGTAVFGALDRSVMNIVLRWAAAVSLGWIGMSMIGLVPVPEPLHRLAAMVSDRLAAMTSSVRLSSAAGLYAAGCVWGLFPCAMVYAALFYAMLSGSAAHGALAMAGFGLGTLLPVLGSGLGFALLSRRHRAAWLRPALGVLIVLTGVASAAVPAAKFAEWCGLG
jgi:sulfite exporter TauE/SafE